MRKLKVVVVLTVVMMLLVQSVAFAAMPEGTVVIGNKAYDLNYANSPANRAEIMAVLSNAETVYVKTFDGEWVENDGTPVSSSVIPAASYKSTEGTAEYASQDKDATPVPTATNTPAPTATPEATATVAPTATPEPTATNTPAPTATDAPTATPTETPAPTPTPDVVAPVITTSAASVDVTAVGQKVTFTVVDANIVLSGIVVKQGTATLTVTKEAAADTYSVTLADVQGANQTLTVDATDISGNAATQKSVTLVDKTKPTITSAVALNNKTIVITYSEKVTAATALTAANYTLYNENSGLATPLQAGAAGGANAIQAVIAFTDTTEKTVKISILGVGTAATGYPMGGLSNASYRMYVSSIVDVATAPNTIIGQSNTQFSGTLTPDSTGPNLVTSAFNSATGAVTLTFDKAVSAAVPASDKIYFKLGANTVLLKNPADYTGIAYGTQVTFTVNTTAVTGTLAAVNALGSNPQLVLEAGAFTDGTNTSTAITVTPTITTAPVLLSVQYSEVTNTITYNFSKIIDVSKILTTTGKFEYDVDGFGVGGGLVSFGTPTIVNTDDSTALQLKLSDTVAKAFELAMRAEGDSTVAIDLVATTVTDLDNQTNNANTSVVNIVKGTGYVQDTTAAALSAVTYYQSTKTLVLGFSDLMANNIADITSANVKIYKDDNATAGLDTTPGTGDTLIATFADTNAGVGGGQVIGQADMYKADGTGAETLNVEANTLYFKDVAGAERIDAVIDAAIGAGKDVYVVLDANAFKDAQGNQTAAATLKATLINDNSISNANTQAASGFTSVKAVTISFKDGTPSAVPMDSTTVTNIANWNIYVTSNPLNKPGITKIIKISDDTYQMILASSAVASTAYTITATDSVKTTAAKSGLLTLSLTSSAAGAGAVTWGVSPVTTDVDNSTTLTAGDKISLTFSDEVVLNGLTISDIAVNNSHTLGNSTLAELSADMKTLTIVLGSSSTLAIGDTLTLSTASKIKDLEGADMTAVASTAIVPPASAVAPAMTSAVYTDVNANGIEDSGDKMVLTFNQTLVEDSGNPISGLANTDFQTTANATLAAFTAVKTAANQITLTFTAAPDFNATAGTQTYAALGTDVVQLDYATTAVPEIRNGWAMSILAAGGRAIDNSDVDVTSSDATAPVVTSIGYKAGVLTITFSEAVNDSIKTTGDSLAAALFADLNVVVGTGDLGALSAGGDAALSSDKKSVTINLDASETIDQYTQIIISAGVFGTAADHIVDATGLTAVRANATAITVVMLP